MTIEDDRIKAMTWDYPEYIPVTVGILPATWIKHREALEEITRAHPLLFEEKRDRDYDEVSRGTYCEGEHADAWGCVWSNIQTGMEAFVTGHPLPDREDVHKLRAPEVDVGTPHGFMFLRLTYLRGFEEMMIDFAEEPPELQMMIDVVCNYNLRQVRLRLDELRGMRGELVCFGDDLGMQQSLPISPEKWRKYLKPCFARIYGLVRGAGHHVYMHTDGHILEIIPDLIETGVEVINPQVRANGLDRLREACFGKVCVNLDLDRQMFPFCRPADIHAHVREAVAKLGSPKGGVWLSAEIAPDVPLENVEAICAALEKARMAFAEPMGSDA